MAYVKSITTVLIKHVRILNFYLTLGRIRISVLGLNPGFPYLMCYMVKLCFENISHMEIGHEISKEKSIIPICSFVFQYILKDMSPIVLRLFPVSFCSPDLLTTSDEVSK